MLTLGGGALLMLAACQHDATAPSSSAVTGNEANAVNQVRDPLSSRLSSAPGACLVSMRAPDGLYPSRSVALQLPAGFTSDTRRIARVAYRGWSAGVPEPALLAVCSIPDAPGIREYVARLFGGRTMSVTELRTFAQSVGVTGADEWDAATSPQVMQGAQPVYMTDGLASDFPANLRSPRGVTTSGPTRIIAPECDPYAIIPDPACDPAPPPPDPTPPPPPPPSPVCDPNAIIPDPGCLETIPETPPPPPPDPAVAPVGDPALAVDPSTGLSIACVASTDYPHLSTTPGFGGRLNVKSHNSCPVPLPQYVTATLKREKCFLWIFCSWPTIAFGSNSSPSASFITAMANTDCRWRDGWYVGQGYHQTTFPQGVGSTRTWTPAIRIRCW